MGGSQSGNHSDGGADQYFTDTEKQKLNGMLQRMCDEKSRISSEKFNSYLKDRLPSAELRSRLYDYMGSISRSSKSGHSAHVTRNEVMLFLAQVFKGSAEQTAPLVIMLASGSGQNASRDQFKQVLINLLHLAARSVTQGDVYRSWSMAPDYSTERFAEYILRELNVKDDAVLSPSDLESYLMRLHLVQDLIRLGFQHIFPITDLTLTLLPTCNSFHDKKSAVSTNQTILDMWAVACINQSVPHEYRSEWRPLFNSKTQGESFATMLRCIMGRGPSLIVIRDTNGHIFGGFAAESWTLQPRFYGSSHCFLFSVSPTLDVHSPSGLNENYMYLNQAQQTLPNGLGMGGQLEYFGLWLSYDYGSGHSKAQPKCTTYSSPQLSKSTDFRIDHLEVWGVGVVKKPEEGEEEGKVGQEKKGVLNTNTELQNLVEMSGRRLVSKDIRAADAREEHAQRALQATSQMADST